MSLMSQLNLNYLRIFMSVYRTGSMTLAAKELHLTQSGISQQIKALEEHLGIKLFDRISRRLVATSRAEVLYEQCAKHLDELETVLERVANQDHSLVGRIKIGFPPVFGNHMLIPRIAQFSLANPSVKFELRMGLPSEILGLLKAGQLDFAFIDAMHRDTEVKSEVVYKECVQLCCHRDLVRHRSGQPDNVDYFNHLPLVAYVDGEPIVRGWFQNVFGVVPPHMNVVATVIDSHAVARIISERMAAGLLPNALIDQLRQDYPEIQVFDLGNSLVNEVSLCTLAHKTLDRTTSKCLESLKDFFFAELGKI